MTRPHGTSNRYHNGPDENGAEGKGCRCAACRRRVADLKNRRTRLRAYGQWEPPLVDAAGTRRRIQAMMYIGLPLAYQAARLGMSTEGLRQKMGYRRVTPATAARVAGLSREVHCRPLPDWTPAERASAERASRHARRAGFVPLAAWDEIDDPGASPVPGWDAEPARPQRASGGPEVATAIRQARVRAEISQRALAAEVGVTESYIQLLEYGKRNPSVKTWQQLELTLGPLGVVRDSAPEPAGEEADAAA